VRLKTRFFAFLLAVCASAWCVRAFQAAPAIVFENAAAGSGIEYVMRNSATPERHQIETMLAGLALLDYDNDGLLDVYFVNGAKLPSLDKADASFHNRLYRNLGGLKFEDVTEKAGMRGKGYGMGVAAGDYDNDGNVDLYIASVNRNQLFRNNGDGTFADVTEQAGVKGVHPKLGKTWGIGAGWFDYNNDGRLDLFVVNYVNWSIETDPPCLLRGVRTYCTPHAYTGQPNILYRNNGDGTFTDVSVASGIDKLVGKGMGVAFADADGDGFADLFVSNDTFRNFYFRNNGNGTFTEQAIAKGVAYNENGKSIAGMGTDFRDVDNDGLPDIFVVGMIGDTYPLFRNAKADFADITSLSGVARATMGDTAWGAGIVDFDNDGWKDLYATRASILDNSEEVEKLPSKRPNQVLRNLGRAGAGIRFQDVSKTAGQDFQAAAAHRGVAFGDLDNDGRMDAVGVVQNERAELFVNRSPAAGNWLLLRLVGTKSNRDGLGAKVKVTLKDGRSIWNHATTSTGFSTSSDRRVHFGLGMADVAERVEIQWPSGVRQALENVRANQILTVTEAGS
jgi:hypothetical protein